MKEYLCRLGHIHWSLWPPRCPCGAPVEWTGQRRGYLLDDQVAWNLVWGQVAPDPLDARGCWVWNGVTRRGAPYYRGVSVRKEMWEFFTGDERAGHGIRVKCGEERCVRPTHTVLKLGARKGRST